METGQKQAERAFNQPIFKNIKLNTLDGRAYKFSIVFPMSEDEGAVLTDVHRALLVDLLTCDFGGCSLTNDITHPLMQGTYTDKDGNVLKGKHSEIYVYSAQTDESIEYFKRLKKLLEELSGEDEILIELSPVNLLPSD
jgi:hypothetical protein